MKDNGLECDTLDGVIADLEYVQRTWRNSVNQLEYPTLRDAIYYLKAYKEMVDSIVSILCQYKETFKAIIEDIENEDIG